MPLKYITHITHACTNVSNLELAYEKLTINRPKIFDSFPYNSHIFFLRFKKIAKESRLFLKDFLKFNNTCSSR